MSQSIDTFFMNILNQVTCNYNNHLLTFCVQSGAKGRTGKSDRSRQELFKEHLVAKIGFDTAREITTTATTENAPLQAWMNALSHHAFNDMPSVFFAIRSWLP